MKNTGIICDLEFSRHPCFRNYYYAIQSLYGELSLVKSSDDLDGIDILFIGDDHYYFHKLIWKEQGFIDKCNINKIKVVVFTTERILNSYFPWNAENLEMLGKINELYHYTGDVDDCIALGTKQNKYLMSRHYKDRIIIPHEKINEIIFIGATDCCSSSYENRNRVLRELSEIVKIVTIPPTIETWELYMETIAHYRYVLSPIGNGNFFPLKFYETLLVKSIPIQQVSDNTLEHYKEESEFDDCIYFREVCELPSKLENFKLEQSHHEIWLEDYIEKLLKEDRLL